MTGYYARTAEKAATIAVVDCRPYVTATTSAVWSPWSLLLADGVTASPARSWSPDDLESPNYPSGSENIGSYGGCRGGLIPFDVPAADKADPVEIEYNSGTTHLFGG